MSLQNGFSFVFDFAVNSLARNVLRPRAVGRVLASGVAADKKFSSEFGGNW